MNFKISKVFIQELDIGVLKTCMVVGWIFDKPESKFHSNLKQPMKGDPKFGLWLLMKIDVCTLVSIIKVSLILINNPNTTSLYPIYAFVTLNHE